MDRLLTHRAMVVYADGGLIAKNPSPYGGTWAYRIVSPAGDVLREDSGAYAPSWAGLPAIGNNDSETLALCTALEALEAYRDDTTPLVVCSDSLNALRRLFTDKLALIDGIGYAHLRRRVLRLRRVLYQEPQTEWQMVTTPGMVLAGDAPGKVVLLEGHPSLAMLAAGYGRKGYPVSRHQDWCDKAAKAAGRVFQEYGTVGSQITVAR